MPPSSNMLDQNQSIRSQTLQQEVPVYVLRASNAKARLCAIVAGGLFLGFLVSLPLARKSLPHIDAFIPMIDSVLLLGDLVTATLLARADAGRAHGATDRNRSEPERRSRLKLSPIECNCSRFC